jgi:hypothetical protein
VKRGRPAARRIALTLPVPLAARLAAWCEMHPQRTRSQWLLDWLDAALVGAERSLPRLRGAVVDVHPDTRQPIYLLTGPFAEFHGLVNKHHLELEHELDHEAPEAPYPAVEYLLGEE